MKRSISYTAAPFDNDGRLGPSSPVMTVALGELIFGTFQLVHGVFPPRTILNNTLSGGSFVDVNNLMYEWRPFALDVAEYEALREEVRATPRWGIEIDDSFQGSDPEWSHWAFIKAMQRARHDP
jgi:hypothetical protein